MTWLETTKSNDASAMPSSVVASVTMSIGGMW